MMSDYNFRGISQSNRGPSVTAYSEIRYNVNSSFQLYFATQYWAVTLPTNPTAEVDIFGGFRVTQGPVALDIGGMYYWYPRERQHNSCHASARRSRPIRTATRRSRKPTSGKSTASSTWEVVKDRFALGANVYYSPSWLNTGA